jgi:hypothetical protein
MKQVPKFILCFAIAMIAYLLGRYIASAVFEDPARIWLSLAGGVSAATAFYISGRLLDIVNFSKKDPEQDQL